MNIEAIKSDLESLDGDHFDYFDVRVWRRAVNDADGHLVGGDVSKISVEAVPADGTEFLTDVMKAHGLAISEVRCGERGLIADLRPAESFPFEYGLDGDDAAVSRIQARAAKLAEDSETPINTASNFLLQAFGRWADERHDAVSTTRHGDTVVTVEKDD